MCAAWRPPAARRASPPCLAPQLWDYAPSGRDLMMGMRLPERMDEPMMHMDKAMDADMAMDMDMHAHMGHDAMDHGMHGDHATKAPAAAAASAGNASTMHDMVAMPMAHMGHMAHHSPAMWVASGPDRYVGGFSFLLPLFYPVRVFTRAGKPE